MSIRLETKRLLLRAPCEADVAAIVPLIADYDVVKNLARAPHPYREEHAREFIAHMAEARAKGQSFVFAITRKTDAAYMGNCGLHLETGEFELGYWLGRPYWGQGYATEAAHRLACFAFGDLKAVRINAGWFHDNPASGRVLAKVGFVATRDVARDCLARGHAVLCHEMTLERETFGRKGMAA